MALVQEWVDSIKKDLSEPLDGTIARQVRYAIQDFFRDSESWRYTEDFAVIEGTSDYPLIAVPDNTYAIALDWAYFTPLDGDRIKLTSTLIQNINPDVRYTVNYLALDNNIAVLDSDKEPGLLEVQVILQPNRNIDDVDDLIVDKWFEFIRRGAIAKLLSLPDQIWSNEKSAKAHQMFFQDGIVKARREARRDRSRPKRVVKFNKGFSW